MLDTIKEKLANIDKEYIVIGIIIIIIIISIIITAKDSDTENVLKEQEEAQAREEEKLNEQKEKIYIHLDGMVNNPGLIELEEGARLNNAIEKAGGLNDKADMELINLAMELEDGSKVYIPSYEDRKKYEEQNKNTDLTTLGSIEDLSIASSSLDIPSSETYASNSNSSASYSKKSGKVNINKATKEELMTLNGVGSATADKIIEYRELEGGFKQKEQLLEVSGIGDKKYNKIKDNIVL